MFKKIKDYFNSIFHPKAKLPSAKEAYLKRLYGYGCPIEDEQRLNTFFSKLADLIENKSYDDSHCTVTIKPDIIQYRDKIIEKIIDSGYTVIDLQKTNFSTKPILFISWEIDFDKKDK